ncbi:MAG: efflux RND transporter permease subunit [Mangrovibacterium sp.]
MTFLALLIVGLVAMQMIPVSMLPDVDIPEITIRVSAPNKSVDEVEQSYVSRIRRQMLQLTHLDDIESVSSNESGSIVIRFDYGTDINYAFVEVNEKMDAIMSNMPSDFERPRIIKASASDVPVFYLGVKLAGKGLAEDERRFMEMSEFSEQIIKKRIEQLLDVAMVDITGMEYPEISIKVNFDELHKFGIDYSHIKSALEENNISLGNITVSSGMYQFNVKYSTFLKNRQDIENVALKANGRIFYIRDIAQVSVAPRVGRGVSVDKDGQVIIMAVIKRSDAKLESLRIEIQKLIKIFREDYPRLSFEVMRNQTDLLDYSISNLKGSLLISGILAFLVMLLFIKDFRSSLLIGISVPVSLLVCMLFFFLFDISLNIISLSGLILGVGMMIDNSIIVIDNILQSHRDSKEELEKSVSQGTVEVWRPLLSSVLTTCAVFIPLIFLSGIVGALFYDQAMAITIGLFSSLATSILFIPVLYAVLHRRKKKQSAIFDKIGIYDSIEDAYKGSFDFLFAKRRWFIGVCLLITGLGIWAFVNIDKERFPKMDEAELEVYVDWNKNISVEENQRRILQLVSQLDSSFVQFSGMIGEQSFIVDHMQMLSASEAMLYFKMATVEDKERIEAEIAQHIRSQSMKCAKLKACSTAFLPMIPTN